MSDGTHSLHGILKKISTNLDAVTPDEITEAISRISQDQCSAVQTGALLTAMHYTGLDMKADVIAAAAEAMRRAGLQIHGLRVPPQPPSGVKRGVTYKGGLVDIVGTGGDGHDTFNVSTTAAIVAAGCGIRICKHGSRASTSASGSADILTALGASLPSVSSSVVRNFYAEEPHPQGSFVFLFAPVFHPAMKHIAPIRKELGCRTVFNILGPIINPVDYSIPEGLEARVLGVGKMGLGAVYAETLKLLGVTNALVVCGEEDLDEVSIAGCTKCWWVKGLGEVIETFKIHPTETFGVGCHELREVAGGKGPRENAVLLERLLKGGMERGEPVRDFVTVNAAALVVVAGAVEGEEEVGVDGIIRGERWRRAVEVVDGALADEGGWKAWEKFRDVSRKAEEEERLL